MIFCAECDSGAKIGIESSVGKGMTVAVEFPKNYTVRNEPHGVFLLRKHTVNALRQRDREQNVDDTEMLLKKVSYQLLRADPGHCCRRTDRCDDDLK